MVFAKTNPTIALRNILVATDLSSPSMWSLPYVVAIAQRFGSTVFLANVIPSDVYALARPGSLDVVEAECLDHAQHKLDRVSARIKAQRICVRTLVKEGDVGASLLAWVTEHRIDLLAMGTTGRSGIRKLFLGSVAEHCIRTSPCAALTVGPAFAGEAPAPLRTILCATDFSADSIYAVGHAFAIMGDCGGRLILLHVSEENNVRATRSALERLREVLSPWSNSAVESEALVAHGPPAVKIMEIAVEHSADLIAIGVRGSRAHAQATSYVGPTAHEVIVAAASPVLSVHALAGH